MISRDEFQTVLAEAETIEVSVMTHEGQKNLLVKPKVKMLNEGHNPTSEFVLFDDNTKTFVDFDFSQVRGVTLRY